MLNIDNFYNLMCNLLSTWNGQPSETTIAYFFPHGSVKSEDIIIYNTQNMYTNKNCVMLYDQEPLSSGVVNRVNAGSKCAELSHIRRLIFGNSELGKNKEKILKFNPYLIDFYYFFHGFAALDWYRNHRFYCMPKSYTKDFLINSHGITGHRSYRPYLIARLNELDLLDNSYFSFALEEKGCGFLDAMKFSGHFYDKEINFCKKHINFTKNVSYDQYLKSSASAIINEEIYSKVRFQIVTETCFFDDRLFLTEKIFQPIVTKTPFMLAGTVGSLDYLKDYGFKTYEQFLPCGNNNSNWRDRLDTIVKTTEWFSKLSPKNKDELCYNMQEIAEYNYNHFFNGFFDIIFNEMKSNFLSATEYNRSLYN